MSDKPGTLTPQQQEAAREAFEARYVGYRWWLERFDGEQHPALRKDENGEYESEYERRLWKGFQEGYLAALTATRDSATEAHQELIAMLTAAIEDKEARVAQLGKTRSIADRLNLGSRIAALKEARGYVEAMQRGEQPFSAARRSAIREEA